MLASRSGRLCRRCTEPAGPGSDVARQESVRARSVGGFKTIVPIDGLIHAAALLGIELPVVPSQEIVSAKLKRYPYDEADLCAGPSSRSRSHAAGRKSSDAPTMAPAVVAPADTAVGVARRYRSR